MLRNDSFNIREEIISQLKKTVPSIFAEGELDLKKLNLLLAEESEGDNEKFGLHWNGKSEAIKSVNVRSKGTLRINEEKTIDANAENLIIEGDNLEVLKLIQKSYYGKVKLIYIDPPYNTGNDFIYKDNFNDSLGNYLMQTGQLTEEGHLTSSNVESSGRKHSNWLNMIYPRILLSRSLLTDDGVILISIDDHEYARLKEVLDEIFGEEGHLATFVWRRRIGSSMSSSWISNDHEYILAYSKNPENVFIKGEDRDMTKYSIPDGEGRFFASMPLTVGMNKSMRPGQWYELEHPITKNTYLPPEGRVWAYYPPTMEKKIKENKVLFPDDFPNRKMTVPRLKSYPEDAQRDMKPLSTWIKEKKSSNKEVPLDDSFQIESPKNEEGTRVLKSLLGESYFTYPKPLTLIQNLVDQFTKNNDIVMDFFAGSGTTAHAVLEANKNDLNNRKFILVQLPEPIQHEKFNTIADVTRERIIRAAEVMNIDTGFRYFELDSSNFKEWDNDITSPSQIREQMELWKEPIKEGRSQTDLLYEILLKAGFTLTANIVVHNLNEEKFFIVKENNQSVLIYLGKEVTDLMLKEMLSIPVTHVYFIDEAFESDDQKKNIQLQWEEEGVAFRSI